MTVQQHEVDARARLDLDRNLDQALDEVRFAYEHQPFFRDHLRASGLTPSDLRTLEDFQRIPPSVKADYRRNFPKRLVTSSRPLDDRLIIHSQSSGTGGDRLITVAFAYDLAKRMHDALAVHPPFRAELRTLMSAPVCRFAPPNCSEVECAAPLATMQDRMLSTGALVLPVAHDLLATPPRLTDQIIDEIATYQPRWIDADSTHLAFLIRSYRERGEPLPDVRAILLSYTMGTRVARRQIREAFPDVCTTEVVMMTELGYVAVECPAGILHLNTTSFFTELIRDGRQVEVGAMGELVATSLGDRLLPHIRYETGDVYRLLGGCECALSGDGQPAVRFEGRWRHMMVRDGEIRLTPRDVDDLVGDADWMSLYRLQQVGPNHFRFNWVRAAEAPALADELRDRLHAGLGGGPSLRLDFEAVDHIATDRTGKFVSCISTLPDAAMPARGH